MSLPSPLLPTVEINPTGSAWVDITSYVRDADGVDIDTGRADESDTVGPTTCRLRVDNRGGHFSRHNPNGLWYPDLGLGTPLRAYWDTTANMLFSGDISELPTRWDQANVDSTAPIVASSALRRLEQGAVSLRSAAFRSLSTHANVVAYWPCEDNDGSTQAASPIAGVRPWAMPAEFSSIEGPAGSDSLLRVVAGTPATFARVPFHTAGDVYVAQVAYRMDEAPPAGREVLNVYTTSTTLAHWSLSISDTSFIVRAWNADDVLVVNSSEAVNSAWLGQWVRAELRLFTNASSVSWAASIVAADADATVLNDLSATEASTTKGRVTRMAVGFGGNWGQDRYFGHLAVLTGTRFELPEIALMDRLTVTDRDAPFHGWTGELAADRFERLCAEEDLTCTVLAPTGGLRESTGVSTDNASTPDAAALDITGDIDLRCWLSADDWADGNDRELIQKWETTGDQRSYALQLGNDGEIQLRWSTDGTLAGEHTVGSNVPLTPMPPGDNKGFTAVRATLDVDNGAAGHDVNIYRGPSLDGPWMLHYSQTIAGTTSIFSGSASLKVAGDGNGTPLGVVRGARVYSGIAGTLVADPDFTAQAIGATSFTDSTGNTWTVNGDAEIVRADDSMQMGPQLLDTVINNFRDCAAADQGRFYEDPDGLVYRTRTDLYNQAAALALASTDLAYPPEPTDDDQQARNDVTITRPNGSSARYEDADHIADHGRYNESMTGNVSTDDWAAQLAAWRVHLGTVDEMRWPRVELKLHAKPNLIDTWLGLRLGDRLTISHDLTQLPGVDIDLLVEGWTEHIDQTEWNVALNCVPASPYDVAVFGTARFDAVGSTTSGSFVAGTGTSLTVATQAGSRPWVNSTDHASEFPFHIKVSGVVLNVTAISGSTSPQTFTVDATTVNGVTKTIASGSAVQLADTPIFAL